MNLNEIIKIASGNVLTSEAETEHDIKGGYTADLMSDVLASVQPESVLLTRFCNPTGLLPQDHLKIPNHAKRKGFHESGNGYNRFCRTRDNPDRRVIL